MKNPSPPEFSTLFQRVASGELTRAQAASLAHEQTGRSPNTFLGWIVFSKERRELLKPVRLNVGVNNVHAHKDPDKVKAYADALALALSRQTSARAAAKKFNVDYKYLLIKVAKARGTQPKTMSSKRANDASVQALEQALDIQTNP